MIRKDAIVFGALFFVRTAVEAFTPTQRRDRHSKCTIYLSNGDEFSRDTPYRSIGEVVGGLHGGKYQFEGSGAASDYVLSGPSSLTSSGCAEEVQEKELPNWALRMKPRDDAVILEVPSNANRQNGMIRSASITITNDERTWEKFYAKIVSSDGADSSNTKFVVRPSTGDLAPRGGASNACDASQPYSDSATLQVIHNESVLDNGGVEYWLIAGTEEEQWSYRLRLSSLE